MAVLVSAAASGSIAVAEAPAAPFVVHRVNVGGPAIAPDWEADTAADPSEFVNGSNFSTSSTDVDLSDPSVPPGTPEDLFDDERWDSASTPAEMSWHFPVTPGPGHVVRLYFAETYFTAAAQRRFDVRIEGNLVLNDYDIFAEAGGDDKAIVEELTVTSDATLDVVFEHADLDNPAVKAIEVLSQPSTTGLAATPGRLDFEAVATGATRTRPIQITNNGGSAVTLESTSISGDDAALFADDFDDAGSTTLPAGGSTTIDALFTPAAAIPYAAVLSVTHSGSDTPLRVKLRGDGRPHGVAFDRSDLAGATSAQPTALQWGPDGRLYVAELASATASIKAYTIARNGPSDYEVTAAETINNIAAIPNHNDDGSLNTGLDSRLITGMLVTGTVASPVIYVTSSDPRMDGGGPAGTDTNLDTNSSMISRLTRSGGVWTRNDVVRGLPRSEENHAANGLALDPATNTLFLAQGGNTNHGAPSNNFALLPDFAYSAAILSIDLDHPELSDANLPYDLPTLDDEDKANVGSPAPGYEDVGDPFGGNDGKNQAELVPGGPVQVYAPGFRNPYDVVWTSDAKLFSVDNGGNAGWGSSPTDEGSACTNAVQNSGLSDPDALHRVTAGYYGGHPNPTRANDANKFNTGGNAQSPVAAMPADNPVECDYRPSDSAETTSLATFPGSTNGLDEYTASNFGGQMQGDLVIAGYGANKIFRVERTADGNGVAASTTLVNTAGAAPLSIDAVGDSHAFPGTIWVADLGMGLYVLEPSDATCAGDSDPAIDEDGDGFTNEDEVQNGTNPCSSADRPRDADDDDVSNLNDLDDDNDGRPDTSDPFAVDAANGLATDLPVVYGWENGATPLGDDLTTYRLGFTGLMTNGSDDYRDLYDQDAMTEVGAAGVLTLDEAGAGDAAGPLNSQAQGFQFGVDPGSAGGKPFAASTRILSPFAGGPPSGRESLGLFVGSGDQDNYVKLVAGSLAGAAPSVGVRLDREVAGSLTEGPVGPQPLPVPAAGANAIDLFLVVDPTEHTVRGEYAVSADGVMGPRIALGAPVPIPASWTAGSGQGLAVGIISTSRGGDPFAASWDFLTVTGVAESQPPPDPDPRPAFARARLASGQKAVRVRRGRARFRVVCPAQQRPRCRGRLVLRSRQGIPLGSSPLSIAQGRTGTVSVAVNDAGRRLLRARGTIRAKVILRVRAPDGSLVTRVQFLTLRSDLPRPPGR